jgi:ABC-type glycerol-3-phosphate transport system permease component
MTALAPNPAVLTVDANGDVVKPQPQRRRRSGALAHLFIIALAVLWMIPLLWTVYTSLRPESDTNARGYFSFAHALTFQNFKDAWTQGQIPHYFWN